MPGRLLRIHHAVTRPSCPRLRWRNRSRRLLSIWTWQVCLSLLRKTISFLQRLGLQRGCSLLILGSGPVDLSFTLAAKMISAYPVLVTGRRPEPLQVALIFGADQVIKSALKIW